MATLAQVVEEIKGMQIEQIRKDYVLRMIGIADGQIIARKLMAPKKPKRIITKSPLLTLQDYEQLLCGRLTGKTFEEWAADKKLCIRTVDELVDEFRIEMISKGKEYADFIAAFKVYLTKGYLSKKLDQALWVNSPYRKEENVRMMQRGSSI